jgi:cytochrome c-type biogenesis protein CcmF
VSALLLTVAFARHESGWPPLASFGLLLAAWCFWSTLAHAWERLAAGAGNWRARARRQPLAWYGMLVAHAGIGVFVFGVTLANGLESRRELALHPGESVVVDGHTFTLEGVAAVQGPNYDAQRASVRVTRGGEFVALLQPEKRVYRARGMPLGQSAIDTGLTRDLLVALGEPAGAQAWSLRIQVKPFMAWIWAGCLALALGGLLALSDRRYRPGSRRVAAAEPRLAQRAH